jgi:glycosyltransferase involved in cell wall biosynthesis
MINIGWLGIPKKERVSFHMGGGDSYRSYLFHYLNNSDDYRLNGYGIGGFLSRDNIISLYRSFNLKGEQDIWLHDMNTIIYPHKKLEGQHVLLFHHIGGDVPSPYNKINNFLNKRFYQKLDETNYIVVVSKYWEEFFEKKGFKNIKIIYNPFDLQNYQSNSEQVQDFKLKYNLQDKPIVYIGNCHELKGVNESYNSLKDLDVNLVTSGRKRANIPVVNLNLEFREYLLLLKASSVVVTMSQFPEGWCRTAHEAMLCHTPVIGSGKGGMKELLDCGNQLICTELDKLKSFVEYAIETPELGYKGYKFASGDKFSLKNFNKEFDSFFKEISNK